MRRLLAAAAACLAAAGAWAQERAAEDPWGIAVIVANSRYADPVPDVRWADRDAAAMRRFAIDVLGYREGNVFVLEDATLSQMTAMFGSRDTPNGRLHKRVRKDESDVLVFYSGHGFPAQKHGVLLPADADALAPAASGYPVDLLLANLEALPARSVTVLLDACFSGRQGTGVLIPGAKASFGVEPVPPPKRSRMTVLTAAQGSEYAVWDDEAQHGLFTEYLLRGLYGAADASGDKRVTAVELETFLARDMSYRASSVHNTFQTPQLTGDADRVLAAWRGRPPARPELAPATGDGHTDAFPPPVVTSASGSAARCREFRQLVVVKGVEQMAYGKACQLSDGSWKIVSE